MSTIRASSASIRQQVSIDVAITSRSFGSARGTRARVRKLLVRLLTRIGVGSIRAPDVRSSSRQVRSPGALPRVSCERSSTASRVITGRGRSGIVSTRCRPITLGSRPVPL